MYPYWILFSIFAVGAVQTRDRQQSGRTDLLLIAAVLFAILMVGLRYRVGGDWNTYQKIFDYVGMLHLGSSLTLAAAEPGYGLLNWIAQQLGLEIWFVNLVCAAIFLWGVTRLATQQPNPWLAFVVAVPYIIIVVGMGYTRQAVAIGLIMVAIAEFNRGRMVRFVGYMVAAALFHRTSIVVLPIIALASSRNRPPIFILTVVLGYFLYSMLLADRLAIMTTNYVDAQLEFPGGARARGDERRARRHLHAGPTAGSVSPTRNAGCGATCRLPLSPWRRLSWCSPPQRLSTVWRSIWPPCSWRSCRGFPMRSARRADATR